MNCRHCQTPLHPTNDVFLDLGSAPPSNAFLRACDLDKAEAHLPLKVFSCTNCRLVQVDEIERHDSLFSDDYVYFSSYSSTWVAHAERYVRWAIDRLELNVRSLVVEVASNDGYLLQFVNARGIPCVGIEPTAGTAQAARERGIESIGEFFGEQFATEFAATRRQADLVIGNNVLAHVPDINDFVAGFQVILAPNGAVTVEFPHLLQLVQQGQFDTVYHEHLCYHSVKSLRSFFAQHGLQLIDARRIPTKGGSLRGTVQLAGGPRDVSSEVGRLLEWETLARLHSLDTFRAYSRRIDTAKEQFTSLLDRCRATGKVIAGYGASPTVTTLIDQFDIADRLDFLVDDNPVKQNTFSPGHQLPVYPSEAIYEREADVVAVLAWQYAGPITAKHRKFSEGGGRFVVPLPQLQIS